MTIDRMQFGIFLAPFHRAGENPTLALRRDLDLISYLDELGYDEAWVGEHHSGGWELISSPELFAAQQEYLTALGYGAGDSLAVTTKEKSDDFPEIKSYRPGTHLHGHAVERNQRRR